MGMYGDEGPLSYQTGYAPSFAALSGISLLTGHHGGPSVGMSVRYGDSTYGTAAAFAAVVALMHRRQTGEGQFVDVSAVECLSTMVADSLMDFTLNGSLRGSQGNRHPEMAPHGVYPCQGGEWLSLAVSSDRAWNALAEAMGLAEPPFKTLAERKAHEDELDRLIADWTKGHDAEQLVTLLQARGIAAGKSRNTVDFVSDPQLWARGFFPEIDDGDGATRPILGPSWIMSRGASITHGAPKLGAHTEQVLSEILGLSPEEQQRLAAAGVTR
jgi:crotonobetainyl-CoA:carnitine CoA-transferase CaiB-like acyl-CoA transferase